MEPYNTSDPSFDAEHAEYNNPNSQDPGHGRWYGFFSTVFIIITAIIIAFLLINYVFQSYEVDGPSMQTTLQNHDRLMVYKVPRTFSRLTGHPYIPQRADVIVFIKHDLAEFGINQDKQLIKRVIGLPGDRVTVSNGVITIYNKSHPDGYNPDNAAPYGKVIQTTPGNIDEIVPPESVFVCGDNRVNSLDSRRFGSIPVKDIVGKLVLRIYPLGTVTPF
ncbi:MAG: signal peptidase I [Candidatus Saccharimonadales bacterium]